MDKIEFYYKHEWALAYIGCRLVALSQNMRYIARKMKSDKNQIKVIDDVALAFYNIVEKKPTIEDAQRAASCKACGVCGEHCQDNKLLLHVIEHMNEVHKYDHMMSDEMIQFLDNQLDIEQSYSEIRHIVEGK